MTKGTNEPVVSVVLPVYNCAEYIGDAVQSILDQTFSNFEFIIIDDGSTDRSLDILKEFRDPRIQIISQENHGLTNALNRGLDLARGRYIARQDADDISLPNRFFKQVAFLDEHPSCALVGTWADIWLEREKTGRAHHHPSENAELQFELLFNNPFVHSSVMLRKSALEHVGAYASNSFPQTGDFELWSRIARQNEIANIPEVLQIYREVHGSVSRDSDIPILSQLVKLSAANLAWASGSDPENPDVINLAAMVHSARNHIIGRPNFRTMREILRRAIERIAVEHRVALQRKAHRRINGLQIRYTFGGLFKEQRVQL